jgi:hypothetical protein
VFVHMAAIMTPCKILAAVSPYCPVHLLCHQLVRKVSSVFTYPKLRATVII